jgi:hypothetical protein
MVENLFLDSIGDDNTTGYDLTNIIEGNDFADVLDGGAEQTR